MDLRTARRRRRRSYRTRIPYVLLSTYFRITGQYRLVMEEGDVAGGMRC